MNGRVYDPLIGRFLSADPLISEPYDSQGYNRYSYVRNNPMNATDPTGFSGCSVINIKCNAQQALKDVKDLTKKSSVFADIVYIAPSSIENAFGKVNEVITQIADYKGASGQPGGTSGVTVGADGSNAMFGASGGGRVDVACFPLCGGIMPLGTGGGMAASAAGAIGGSPGGGKDKTLAQQLWSLGLGVFSLNNSDEGKLDKEENSRYKPKGVNLDSGSIRALISNDTPLIAEIMTEIGDKKMHVTEMAIHEVAGYFKRSDAKGYDINDEKVKFLALISSVTVLIDRPSPRFMALKEGRNLEWPDKVTLGTGDTYGLKSFTNDGRAVGAINAQGVQFDVYVHRPHRYE